MLTESPSSDPIVRFVWLMILHSAAKDLNPLELETSHNF